jgi:hypothetical protein
MRRLSTKRAAELRQVKKARDAFLAEFRSCMMCQRKPPTDVHEIARGASRGRAVLLRVTWLALCRDCHEEAGDYSKWPITKQLALKLLRDPEHYDRVAVNRIRRRADDAITEEEVRQHIRRA